MPTERKPAASHAGRYQMEALDHRAIFVLDTQNGKVAKVTWGNLKGWGLDSLIDVADLMSKKKTTRKVGRR
jgi:hypothetical protein